jgi:hypothetical protein
MRRRTHNPNPSSTDYLWIALAAVGAFFVVRRVMQGRQTAGGLLGPGEKKDGVTVYTEADLPQVDFNPQSVLSRNPRFASERMADRAYAIQKFGGRVVDPSTYPYTLAGFQAFLDASGVNRQWSSARELAKMNKPAIGAKYGYTLFLPPQVWWPKAAALALLQNRLREMLGEPVVINNWWRPKGYNEDAGVGGAPKGDHPDGDALDLNLRSEGSKWRAVDYLYKLQQAEPALAVSLGVYSSAGTIHAGLQSANGKRTWDYSKPKDAHARITRAAIDEGLRRSGAVA